MRLLLIFSLLLVPQFAFLHEASAATSASDDFNRADGGLGSNWTAISDRSMSIASQQVIGTAGVVTGDIRTAETYPSDQFSQIQVTSTVLSGGGWVAAAVRLQNSGKNGYAGLYYWNFGSPELMLFKRSNGAWTQLGTTYNSGVLAAGTQLQIMAVGSTISFLQNGVTRVSVTDTSFTGGAPGIMADNNSTADNWSGGSASAGGTTSFTVGGSVSGLSGSVVLQDNGGDNLSVAANGSFTFATSLASGAAYAVTVKTNPSGQTCTVVQRVGDRGVGERDQRGGLVRQRGDVHGGRVGVRAVRVGGAEGQRRRQPECDGERVVHLRDLAGVGRGVQRDSGDEPGEPDLHGRPAAPAPWARQRHQRHGHLRD